MKDIRFPKEQQDKITRYGTLNDEKIKLEKEMSEASVVSDDKLKRYNDIISEMRKLQKELGINVEIKNNLEDSTNKTDSKEDEVKTSEVENKINELKEKLKNTKKPKVLLSILLIILSTFLGGFFSMIFPLVGIPVLGYAIYRTIKTYKNVFKYLDIKVEIKKLEKLLNKDNKKSKFSKIKSLFKKKETNKESKFEKTKNWFKNKFSKKDTKDEIVENNNIDNKTNDTSNSNNLENKEKTDVSATKKEKIEELKQCKENIYRLSKKDIHQDKINVNEICNFYGWDNTNPYYENTNKKVMIRTNQNANKKVA